MLKLRMLLGISAGQQPAKVWLDAVSQEPPVAGAPHGCKACPLRLGGEWEAGAMAAVAKMSPAQRTRCSKRWGCHEADRPCAGMVRIAKAAP